MSSSQHLFQRIAPDVKLGKNVRLHDFVNLYGCEIGDDVKIGTFVEIQKGVKIGNRCKISSHTFICEGVTLEDEVFVGHNVTFTNDRYPRATNRAANCRRKRIGSAFRRWSNEVLPSVPAPLSLRHHDWGKCDDWRGQRGDQEMCPPARLLRAIRPDCELIFTGKAGCFFG